MAASIGAVLFRSILLFVFCQRMPLAALPFALSEFLAIGFTVNALGKAKRIDGSLVGACVPFLYGATLLFRADAHPTVWIYPLMAASLLVVLVRLSLFDCLTIGAPVYMRVKSDGLYRYTRHPLATLELLTTWLFLVSFPTLWNAWIATLAGLSIVACAMAEEMFLLGVSPDYYRYCQRVPRRFFLM